MDALRAVMLDSLESQEFIGITPEEINHGDCHNFAMDVKLRAHKLGIEVKVEWHESSLDEPCHAYIVYDGKYYDSECLDGVAQPRYLPIYQRHFAKQRAAG